MLNKTETDNASTLITVGAPEGWKLKTLEGVSADIAYGYTASACSDPVGPKFLRITDLAPLI